MPINTTWSSSVAKPQNEVAISTLSPNLDIHIAFNLVIFNPPHSFNDSLFIAS